MYCWDNIWEDRPSEWQVKNKVTFEKTYMVHFDALSEIPQILFSKNQFSLSYSSVNFTILNFSAIFKMFHNNVFFSFLSEL